MAPVSPALKPRGCETAIRNSRLQLWIFSYVHIICIYCFEMRGLCLPLRYREIHKRPHAHSSCPLHATVSPKILSPLEPTALMDKESQKKIMKHILFYIPKHSQYTEFSWNSEKQNVFDVRFHQDILILEHQEG